MYIYLHTIYKTIFNLKSFLNINILIYIFNINIYAIIYRYELYNYTYRRQTEG